MIRMQTGRISSAGSIICMCAVLICGLNARAVNPRIESTVPEIGARDVDPAIKEIRVTFDRDMEDGMSWTGSGEAMPAMPKNQKAKWADKRTCVLPVKLEAGKFYRVGINSTDFQNFKGVNGYPARPKVIYFTTKGATEEILARLEKPMVAAFDPDSGSEGVSSGTTELKLAFDVPMSPGMSWVGSGDSFPQISDGVTGSWSEDGKTCTLPVKLEPNSEYRISLNGILFINFQSSWGVPLDPVDYSFRTGP